MQEVVLGNDSAFEQLYSRYSDRIYGFLRKRVVDESAVQEIFQETFMRLFQARSRYNQELPFLPWLFTICRNVLFDRLRKESRLKEIAIDESSIPFGVLTASTAVSSDQEYSHYLENLSEREKRIVELHFVEDLPFSTVAKKLGLSSGNVRQISSRAIRKLKQMLKS